MCRRRIRGAVAQCSCQTPRFLKYARSSSSSSGGGGGVGGGGGGSGKLPDAPPFPLIATNWCINDVTTRSGDVTVFAVSAGDVSRTAVIAWVRTGTWYD